MIHITREIFSSSNHRIRKKTTVNLSKQIVTTNETSVFELRLAFCLTMKRFSKEQTAIYFYIFIRRLKLHEYFYENPNKPSSKNTSNTRQFRT